MARRAASETAFLCSSREASGTEAVPWTRAREHKPGNTSDHMSATAYGLARTGSGPGSDVRKRLPPFK
jgi:hypothetical protein